MEMSLNAFFVISGVFLIDEHINQREREDENRSASVINGFYFFFFIQKKHFN